MSYKELKNKMFEYKTVVQAVEKDTNSWSQDMENYQRKLKEFIQRLADKELTLYEMYIATTITSDYILTPSKWRRLLSP